GAVLSLGGLTVIDDTYNANPASLRWALKLAHWLADRRRRPLAVVVGSMLELGPESGRLHAAAAAEIAALRPALVAAVGAFVPAFEPHRPGARVRVWSRHHPAAARAQRGTGDPRRGAGEPPREARYADHGRADHDPLDRCADALVGAARQPVRHSGGRGDAVGGGDR